MNLFAAKGIKVSQYRQLFYKQEGAKNMITRRIKIISLLFISSLFTYKVAYANVPIGAALVMAFPSLSMRVTSGLALLVAILIEGLVLKKRLDLNFAQAFKASFLANAFSTLIGIGIVAAYSAGLTFLICWIPGAILLRQCFKILAEKTGYLVNFAKRKIVSFISFLGIGLIGMVLGSLLLPWSDVSSALYRGRIKMPEPNFFLIIPAFIILLILGFIITIITEGVIIARLFPQKQKDILAAVVVMNFFSYCALLLVTGIDVLRLIF